MKTIKIKTKDSKRIRRIIEQFSGEQVILNGRITCDLLLRAYYASQCLNKNFDFIFRYIESFDKKDIFKAVSREKKKLDFTYELFLDYLKEINGFEKNRKIKFRSV